MAGIAANETVNSLIAGNDLARGLMQRIAGGESADEAMLMVHDLADSGRFVALDRTWVPGADVDGAVRDYEMMIALLGVLTGSVGTVVNYWFSRQRSQDPPPTGDGK